MLITVLCMVLPSYGITVSSVNPTDNANMVWVPAGTFTMGSSNRDYQDEPSMPKPAHRVSLTGYWIYTNEVTVAQYSAFCTATSHTLPTFPTGYSWAGKSGWSDTSMQQHPIVNVSWEDCMAYAVWAGVTLPTEAQWEYAARGPQGLLYPWGMDFQYYDHSKGSYIREYYYPMYDISRCSFTENSGYLGKSIWPVGSFPAGASWCGANDLSGNVWEWCADRYGDYSSKPVTNPTGPPSGDYRVLRGGAWNTRATDTIACYRGKRTQLADDDDIGFRCVSNTPGLPPLTAVVVNVSPANTVLFGIPVTLTATATGGASLQYKFMYGNVMLRDFATSNSYVWTPGAVKTYSGITVIAKDIASTDPLATVTSPAISITTKNALTAVALVTSPLTTCNTGTAVTLTATATGGASVQYKFMAGTTVIRDFNVSNTYTWTPATVQTYNLTVVVKDTLATDPNATVTSAIKSFVVTSSFVPLTSVSVSAVPASLTIGSSVNLTATATGGAAVQYKFMYGTIMLRDFAVANSYTFTPAAVKTYSNITVIAKDTGGVDPTATVTSPPINVVVNAVVSAPTIASFSPISGGVSTSVTIIGTNLSGAVKFNGITSTEIIVNGNSTSITATVPVGATTGKISVITSGGTATSTTDFTVISSPTITSFSPTTGAAGTVIVITGTNLTGATAVQFNGISATIFTVDSASTISVTVPAGATTGKISVTTQYGTATSATDFIPALSSVVLTTSPVNTAVLGTPVTLTATATGGITLQYKFMYGTLMLRDFATTNSYTFTPSAIKTYSNLTVIAKDINPVPNISITSAPVSFVVTAPPLPTITSVTPSIGEVGTVVTITGTNLTGASVVKFNGTTVITITNITASSLNATVPVGATTGKISVTTPGGIVNSVDNFIVNSVGVNPGDKKINPIDGATMVWVPGNTFTMGTEYDAWWDAPYTQRVTLSGYWIYKYEVTVAQYRAFCSATGRMLPHFPQPITDYYGALSNYSWAGKTGWDDATLQQHPIVNVTWYDCRVYADWAGVILPTEAQWEYAARGPEGCNYPWGGIANNGDNYNGWDITKCANYDNSFNVEKSTRPVGSFSNGVSWCGAQDMAGNVWGWCNDWYGKYSTITVRNTTGPTTGYSRVLSGWLWKEQDIKNY